MNLKSENGNNYKIIFALMTSLFFLWGGIISLNDILIPHFKSLFDMNYTKTMLVQLTFFGTYFVLAIPASILAGKIGYKKGIVLGLAAVAIGCLLFLPASALISYWLFLFGLFVIASGTVLLGVVGTPYVSMLGPSKTASSRLNLAEGVNSIGTVFMPLLGAFIILGNNGTIIEEADAVRAPYVGLAVIALILAAVFSIIKLPAVSEKSERKVEGNVLRFRQVRMGVIALTLYVGAEVSIGSFLVSYLGEPYIAGFSPEVAARYIPVYWGGLLIGRFIGAAILQKSVPSKVLVWAALASVILISISIVSSGTIAMWSMICIGLFNSIMWSNIFTMSINGLGEYTIKASGILLMAPVGGAIFPLLQGVLADLEIVGLHSSYILPMLCYIFVIFYGLSGYKPSKGEIECLPEPIS